jgi:hypothetical protein
MPTFLANPRWDRPVDSRSVFNTAGNVSDVAMMRRGRFAVFTICPRDC